MTEVGLEPRLLNSSPTLSLGHRGDLIFLRIYKPQLSHLRNLICSLGLYNLKLSFRPSDLLKSLFESQDFLLYVRTAELESAS